MNTSRDRAWRRWQTDVHLQRRQNRKLGNRMKMKIGRGRFAKVKGYPAYGEPVDSRPSKEWKMVYWRSRKLKRAAQLGFAYPRQSWRVFLLELEELI